MDNKNKKIVFRVDGGKGIGYGHLNRSLALAEFFKLKGFDVSLITTNFSYATDNWIKQQINIIKFDCVPGTDEDLIATKEYIDKKKPKIVVIDGYSFNERYQKSLLSNKFLLILIDDDAVSNISADIVLNQNPGAEKRYLNSYPNVSNVFLGSTFALLRNELKKERKFNSNRADRNILITFGGDDSAGLSIIMARELLKTNENFKVSIIVDPISKIYNNAKQLADKFKKKLLILKPSKISLYLNESSLLITAGGTTVLEALYFNVPTIVITTAHNQIPGIEYLSSKNAVFYAGHGKQGVTTASNMALKIINNKKIQKMLKKNSELMIDGNGVERFVEQIINI